MFISSRLIQAFQKEHKQKFGESISDKEAERDLSNLAELTRLIAKERRTRHAK